MSTYKSVTRSNYHGGAAVHTNPDADDVPLPSNKETFGQA